MSGPLFQEPPTGGGRGRMRSAAGQLQLEHSLDDCLGRVNTLRRRLDDYSPTRQAHATWHPSRSSGSHRRVPAPSDLDAPGVDATLTAIGIAAQSLLRGLVRPADGARASDHGVRVTEAGPIRSNTAPGK
jgi:hypothetical protein